MDSSFSSSVLLIPALRYVFVLFVRQDLLVIFIEQLRIKFEKVFESFINRWRFDVVQMVPPEGVWTKLI